MKYIKVIWALQFTFISIFGQCPDSMRLRFGGCLGHTPFDDGTLVINYSYLIELEEPDQNYTEIKNRL